jgi:hypothetical protein
MQEWKKSMHGVDALRCIMLRFRRAPPKVPKSPPTALGQL